MQLKRRDVNYPLYSLVLGKFEWNFRYVIFKWILVIVGFGVSCEIALLLISLDFTDDESILVHVMAWCRQAPSHYLRQCWPRYLSSYGVTRPQWVLIIVSRGDMQCTYIFMFVRNDLPREGSSVCDDFFVCLCVVVWYLDLALLSSG